MINVARLRPALGFRPINRQIIRRHISPSAVTKPVSQRDNMSSEPPPKFWSVGEDIRHSPLTDAVPLWNPTLWDTIEKEIDALDPSLRELSLNIHGRSTNPHSQPGDKINPSSSPPRVAVRREVRIGAIKSGVPDYLLPYKRHAHDVLTDYVSKQGFEVRRNYILPTGWEARFTHGSGGRIIGVNSGD